MTSSCGDDRVVEWWIFDPKAIFIEFAHDVIGSDLEQSRPCKVSFPVVAVVIVKEPHQGDQITLVLPLFISVYDSRHGRFGTVGFYVGFWVYGLNFAFLCEAVGVVLNQCVVHWSKFLGLYRVRVL